MEWELSGQERTHLRELARKQAEYAALAVMGRRKQMWYDLNDAKSGARPPVILETWTFDRDFLPDSIFRCASKAGRVIERQLLRNIRTHELIDDNTVIPDFFEMKITRFVKDSGMGVTIPRQTAKDSQGVETAIHYTHPIKDLKKDLALLKPLTYTLDRAEATAYKEFLEDLLGQWLPVRVSSGVCGNTMLTYQVIQLMGMEAFFMAMYDAPEELHRLMAYLRDNCLGAMRWAQAEGLLQLNNGNDISFGSSYNFTTRLPAPGHDGGRVRLCDMWGSANSQESVGISPAAYHEFCFSYYREVCEPLGLLYYGCCEPVDPFWKDISQLPHLKKVSVSRWANEKVMGETLRGTDIVFSRKPNPNFLSVASTLDEDAWAEHIRQTLQAASGAFLEILIRDVYTVHGNLQNARRAVEIARREIDRHYRH